MGRKIRYWLVPVWLFLFYLIFFNVLGSIVSDPVFYFRYLWFFILLPPLPPLYLLLLCSYVKGQKIFALPNPERRTAILSALVALIIIPLLFLPALFAAVFFNQPEPFSSLLLNIALLLSTLISLRSLGLRPPNGKSLSMCFLPMLVYAALGTGLILVSGISFFIGRGLREATDLLPAAQIILQSLTFKYFGDFELFISFYTVSFTVYWMMKYNHERAESAAGQSPAV